MKILLIVTMVFVMCTGAVTVSAQTPAEKDQWLQALQEGAITLDRSPMWIRDDADAVLIAIGRRPTWLAAASERLRDNDAVVEEAVRRHYSTLAYASERLKQDRDLILLGLQQSLAVYPQFGAGVYDSNASFFDEAVLIRGDVIQYADATIRDTRTIALAAVRQTASSFRFLSDRLKDDDALVLEVVGASGGQLAFASERLKDDDTIVQTAVSQNAAAFLSASARLRDTKALALAAVSANSDMFTHLSTTLQQDADIRAAAGLP